MQYNIYRITPDAQAKLATANTKSEALQLARQLHEEARADGCAIVRTGLRRFVSRRITEDTVDGKVYKRTTPGKIYSYEPLPTGTHDGVCLSWSVNRKGKRVAVLAVLAADDWQEIVYSREQVSA